jgi:hypothetical protein
MTIQHRSYLSLIFSFMKDKQKYLWAKETVTPVGRLKMINSALYKYSTYKPPFSSTFYHGSFVISNGRDSPVSIPIRRIKACLLSSQQQLLAAMRAVLPTSLDLVSLPLHHIEDDFSTVSLHLQPSNQKLLEPYLTACWTGVLNRKFPGGKKLWGKCGLDRAEAEKWLNASDRCFSLAMASICLSTAGANFKALKHQQYSGPARTAFLLNGGIMIFINPFPSNHKHNCNLDLIAVTPELTEQLLILFLVLLPISCNLRQLKGQFHPHASTHLWLLHHKCTNGSNVWLFDDSHMNADLEAITRNTLGSPIDGAMLYQMAFGVLRKEFPALFINITHDSSFHSPVDDLAQHRYSTGVANYGRLTVFPNSPHLIGDQPWRHLAVCQLWQALLGCIPVKDMWKGLVENSNLFSHINLSFDLAFRAARDQVTHFYNITFPLSAAKCARVTGILQSAPYLRGITVRCCCHLLCKQY